MTRMSVPHLAPSPDLPPARRDSSGLIDLRVYASASRDAREEAADELLGVGVLSPLAPTLAPPPAPEGSLRALVIWNVASTLVALGAVAVALWALAAPPAPVTSPADAADEAVEAAPAPAPQPTEGDEAPPAPGAPAAAESPEPGLSSAPTGRIADAPRPQAARPAPARVAPAAEPADRAPATPEPGAPAALPETPTRAQVASTLRGASGAVAQCFAPYEHGVIQTTIAIDGPSGRVRHAQVTGGFAGTPAGSCVARTLREVRFSPFARERLEVAFPYRI